MKKLSEEEAKELYQWLSKRFILVKRSAPVGDVVVLPDASFKDFLEYAT